MEEILLQEDPEEKISKELFRHILQATTDGFWLVSAEGKILDVNAAYVKMSGFNKVELLEMSISDLEVQESESETAAHIEKIIETGWDRFESVHRRKDGSTVDVEVSTTFIPEENRFVGFVRDITERKREEKTLIDGELKFRNLFDSATDGIFILDLDGNFIDANRTAYERLGYTREELLSIHISRLDPPEFAAKVPERLAQIQECGSAVFESAHIRKDGSVMPVEVNCRILDYEGRSVYFSVIRDITERRLVAEKISKSENLLKESQEVAKIGSWSVDLVSNTLDWSEETYRRFDKDPKSFTPTVEYFVGVVHPDDREGVKKDMEDSIVHDASYHVQARIRNESGREWVMEAFGRVEREADGKPVRFAGTAQDITERKKAEEKLRESEEYNRNILNTVDEGFIIVDRHYRILTANRGYCEMVSLPSSEVIGKHCYEVSHQSERPCYEAGEDCAIQKVFATEEPHIAMHRHPAKGGQVLLVETKAFPIRDSSGQVVSAIETINNITERHLLQEERLKTQKLQSIGTLAGGIAHDFNNLLQGVFGNISMARTKIDQKEESLVMLGQAEEALHRTVSLTNQLLTFAKGGKPVKQPVPVLPIVENAARFALSGSSCDYEILPQSDLWQINGDAGQIDQVIQNIVLNAEQSMPQGDKIEIAVRKVPSDSEMPAILAKGDYVSISIRDNGIGIPEKHLERIFDPYFTTKERGSGLGLATSYSIVRNHGGVIVVESQLGEGTTFTIYLPAIREKIREPETVVAYADVRSARVLVMDDEEMIREVTRNLLITLGHECELAEEGKSAVAMFTAARNENRSFDLVLLDLTIRGGMGGVETLHELLAIDPEVKAIVSSGYSNDSALSDYRDRGFRMFLKKPYNLGDLRDAINSLVG